MSDVIAVIGSGSIGQAFARRVSVGEHILLADLRKINADTAAKVLLDAGYIATDVSVRSKAERRSWFHDIFIHHFEVEHE